MWKGVARNPCGRLNAFFYMSKDFVSAFLTEKMGHLLRKTVMFQGTASVKFIELYGLMYVLSPEGENMEVLRLKTHFSTYTAALNHCASTRLSSELHHQQLSSIFLAGYCSISCQEQE